MIRRISLLAGILFLAVIVYATFSPLELRPRTGSVGLEHAAAYFLLALSLALALPRHFWLVATGVAGLAVGLELAQHLTPDRHGELADAIQKLAGAMLGAGVGYIANRLLPAKLMRER